MLSSPSFLPDSDGAPRLAPDVAALLRQARSKLPEALRRIGRAVICYSAVEYVPLVNRVRHAEQYRPNLDAAQKLADDMQAIIDANDEQIVRMCSIGGTDLSGWNAAMRASYAEGIANAQRGLQTAPRLSPAEVIAQLAMRGITVTVVKGDLHVTSREPLSAADAEMLRANKADFVAAIVSKVTVI